VWDAERGTLLYQPPRFDGSIGDLTFHPDGETLMICFGNSAQLWSLAPFQAAGEQIDLEHRVGTVEFSPDGKELLIGSYEIACFHDPYGGGSGGPVLQPSMMVNAVVYAPDGETIVTGSDLGIQIWNRTDRQPAGSTLSEGDGAFDLAFSPDGTLLLAAGPDWVARLWDASTWQEVGAYAHHDNSIVRAAFDPTGRVFVTASFDQTIRLWDVATQVAAGPALRHPSPIFDADMDSSGRRIVAGCSRGEVCLWEIPSLKGSLEQIAVWLQVITGQQLRSNGAVQNLAPDAWRDSRQRLESLGDAPLLPCEPDPPPDNSLEHQPFHGHALESPSPVDASQAKHTLPEQQRHVMDEIVRFGGSCKVVAGNVTYVSFWRAEEVTRSLVRRLVHFPYLEVLHLGDFATTDEDLESLRPLTRLKTLVMSDSRVTDSGLGSLDAFPDLEQLVLVGAQVTDRGLDQLLGLQSLRSLNLGDTEVSDDGIARLKPLAKLERLYLNNTNVTRAGAAKLKQTMPSLWILGVPQFNNTIP
jgi:hypothetical protein